MHRMQNMRKGLSNWSNKGILRLGTFTVAPVLERGLYRSRIKVEQSDVYTLSDKSSAITLAFYSLTYHRRLLEDYIQRNPCFLTSFQPVKLDDDAPRIVKLSNEAGELAGVGPMAAVPGALADLVSDWMRASGCRVRVVENGGEVSAVSDRAIVIGVYAGQNTFSGRFGFLLQPCDLPAGLATSSASVSHAFSFGEADAVIIYAENSAIADALATRVCNIVRGQDVETSVQNGLEVAECLDYIRGALIIRGRYAGMVGRMPKIIRIRGNLPNMFQACHKELPLEAILPEITYL
jgi:ApbE superfamily uncharacterized protein (UPF0280 family)